MEPQQLTLNSDAMTAFRWKMDAAINMVLAQMKEKKLTTGTVTGKIDIVMAEVTDKETGEITTRLEIEPVVNTKIGAKGKFECGLVQGLVMALDKEGIPIVASNQIDIDELLAEKEEA